jgi:hypothetical protein
VREGGSSGTLLDCLSRHTASPPWLAHGGHVAAKGPHGGSQNPLEAPMYSRFPHVLACPWSWRGRTSHGAQPPVGEATVSFCRPRRAREGKGRRRTRRRSKGIGWPAVAASGTAPDGCRTATSTCESFVIRTYNPMHHREQGPPARRWRPFDASTDQHGKRCCWRLKAMTAKMGHTV